MVRLAEESVKVIDHMYAIGAPFAREYGGQLATRSFGGVQVSRTYYTRGQTGQQLEIACAQALQEQIAAGSVRMHTRTEMLGQDGGTALLSRGCPTNGLGHAHRRVRCAPPDRRCFPGHRASSDRCLGDA